MDPELTASEAFVPCGEREENLELSQKKSWENGDLIGFDRDFMGFYSEASDFKGDFMVIL